MSIGWLPVTTIIAAIALLLVAVVRPHLLTRGRRPDVTPPDIQTKE